MDGYYYNDKEKCSLVNMNESSFAIQKMLAKCFEFISATEGYISDQENDLSSMFGVGESRVFIFSHPDKENLRISLFVGNMSLSRMMIKVFVIDENSTLSDNDKKEINLVFANALYFYISRTSKIKGRREKLSANGCGITYIAFIIILLTMIYW